MIPNDDQRICSFASLVGLGLTEPGCGSDAANLQFKARRVGDEYLLSGEKTSISFSTQAEVFVMFARAGRPDAGAHGSSAFLVPANLPVARRTQPT